MNNRTEYIMAMIPDMGFAHNTNRDAIRWELNSLEDANRELVEGLRQIAHYAEIGTTPHTIARALLAKYDSKGRGI